jgi:fatty-acyl-CoA synthase
MTLTQVLEQAAQTDASRKISVLSDGAVVEAATYDRLYLESGQLAAHLQQLGVARGERVAIALPNSVGFMRAFFGICAAGAVAVPLPPPFRFAALDIHVRRISLALRQSGVRFILADRAMANILPPIFAQVDDRISVLCIDEVKGGDPVFVDGDDDDAVLIQYTSGTSGSPKGVVLTHTNLLSNIDAIRGRLQPATGEVGCGWLPLFHDMGLIGQALVPIMCTGDNYLLRPEEFLRRPLRWLEAMSTYGASISSAPSSAYAHCVRHISDNEAAALDLSRWRVALNGSESIDGRVMREFAMKFSSAGFRLQAFLPVYGLAEAALAVTFPPLNREPRTIWARRGALGDGIIDPAPVTNETARELVSVGTQVAGVNYKLVGEDETRPVADNHVGEIMIRGASVSKTYEHGSDLGEPLAASDGWMPTGDLGVEVDGELYIVGRKKEVIIVFGQNYYASDIESVVSAVPGVPSRGVLAAGIPIDSGEGGLLLFIETDDASKCLESDIAESVCHAVSSRLGLSPERIVFLPKGRIDRTSSGKLRRHGIDSLIEEHCSVSQA